MFGFEYPEVFFIFPFIAYCFYRCKEKAKPRYFVHLYLFTLRQGRVDLRLIFKLLAAFFLLFSLASPVTVDPFDPKNRQGIAMMLTIDASGSMVARGFDEDKKVETRFESVKTVVKDFVRTRFNDNIGVVLFGDFAFIATPITYEKEALVLMIDYLTMGMAGENTAIGEGISQSLVALKASPAKSKVIVLLTDGNHNSGATSPAMALKKAKADGVKIYTIGIGKEGSFNTAMLEKIANESGGSYFFAQNAKDLKAVYSEIDSLERSSLRSRDYLFKVYWYAIPLLLALLFMAAYIRSRFGKIA